MTNLQYLQRERNRLVDQWSYKTGQDKVKLLVQIMDLEDDIHLLQQNQSNK